MKGVIHSLFEQLEENKIPYAVLRNYETLPEKPLLGSDVDILIDEKNQKAYKDILNKVVENNKVFILSKKYHFNCLSYFVYQKTPFCFSSWIDAFTKIATKSFVWVDSNFLLKNRIHCEKDFYILSLGAEAAILFLKEILAGFPVKEKYRLRIRELVKEDPRSFNQVLSTHFGQKITKELLEISLNRKWEEAFKKRRELWKILILNTIYHQPIEQISHFFRFLWEYMKEYFRFQKGISIAFIGPDGVGKTTISQGIKNKFKKFPFKKIYYYHGQFGFFPELSKIYNFLSFKKKNSSPYPTEKNLPNKFRALLHLFYYGLEDFLSWPWFLWGRIRGKIFLFDRYFYDFVATSIHRQIPLWLFFTISKFIPHPDLTFIIFARPGEIYRRKKEWPIEELEKQLQAFQSPQLLKLSKCILINNERPLEENLDKIEDEILKSLAI